MLLWWDMKQKTKKQLIEVRIPASEIYKVKKRPAGGVDLRGVVEQVGRDFDSWGVILAGRVGAYPDKQLILAAVKELPDGVLRKIGEMERARLVVRVPEALEETLRDIDENRFPGQGEVENWTGKAYSDVGFWGEAPDVLEFLIVEGAPNPGVDAKVSGNVGAKLDKYEARFGSGNDGQVGLLDTYGYLGLIRLFEEEKIFNHELPLLDEFTSTCFCRKHLKKTDLVPCCYWNKYRFKFRVNDPGEAAHERFRCRSAVLVLRLT